MSKSQIYDLLSISFMGQSLDIEVSFGFLDRSLETYNSKTSKNELVEGYNLTLDTENLDPKKMHELEAIIQDIDHMRDITLTLDGIIKKGIAKIAPTFGIGGVSIDLEIHSTT